MLVSRLIATHGPRRSYLIALALFGAGSLVCAVAPTLPVLLAGRGLQGLGGGLLAGLGYALVRVTVAERLWLRAIALVSAMWGVGNVLGPVLGGLFAQLGLWRGAFWLLVAGSLAVAGVAARSLPGRSAGGGQGQRTPVRSLTILTLATAAVSTASIVSGVALRTALAVAAVVLVALFVAGERTARVTVLPDLTYTRGSALRWLYLSVTVVAVCSTIETFIPLFGQTFAGLDPLVAGLLGAALSWGWSIGQLLSSRAPAHGATLQVAGPLVIAAGLTGYGALQLSAPGALTVAAWFVVLLVAGSGIGVAFPHVVTAAMAISDDEVEAGKASAGVNVTQLIANAFGSALAGFLVSLGGGVGLAGARTLAFGFAGVAVGGVLVARRARRP
jgi:MFS family permease